MSEDAARSFQALRRVLAVISLPALTLGLGACSLFTTMWGPPPGFVSRADRPRSASGLQDFKGSVHCHSFRSHDSTGTIAEIHEACQSVGFDFLVMTDHPSPYSVARGQRGMVGDTLFLVGAELRVPGGTLLAFPLKRYVRPRETLPEYLADIHAQGGLAFVGHAEEFSAWQTPGLDGVEVHNLHAAARRAPKAGVVFGALFTSVSMLFEHLVRPDPAVVAAWDGLDRYPSPIVGGNDAHANIRVLGPLGWVLGSYREVFRVLSTHVLAERLDQESLVEGIRRGRTYVAFDLWRDASGFQFYASREGQIFEMGDQAPRGATLQVRSPVPAEIRILRAGQEVARQSGVECSLPAPGPGVYRVEVYLGGKPWVLSSALAVR